MSSHGEIARRPSGVRDVHIQHFGVMKINKHRSVRFPPLALRLLPDPLRRHPIPGVSSTDIVIQRWQEDEYPPHLQYQDRLSPQKPLRAEPMPVSATLQYKSLPFPQDKTKAVFFDQGSGHLCFLGYYKTIRHLDQPIGTVHPIQSFGTIGDFKEIHIIKLDRPYMNQRPINLRRIETIRMQVDARPRFEAHRDSSLFVVGGGSEGDDDEAIEQID